MGPYPLVTEDCDNDGIVRQGNKPNRQLSETQVHADVLRVMKQMILDQPFYVMGGANGTSW